MNCSEFFLKGTRNNNDVIMDFRAGSEPAIFIYLAYFVAGEIALHFAAIL